MRRRTNGGSGGDGSLMSNPQFKILIGLLSFVLLAQVVLVSYHHDAEPMHFINVFPLDKIHRLRKDPPPPPTSPPPPPTTPPPTPSPPLPHLFPKLPPLPPFSIIPDGDRLAAETLSGKNPTIAGIATILNRFLLNLHETNKQFRAVAPGMNAGILSKQVISSYYKSVSTHLLPLEKAYRGRSVFPIREDDSIFISLASFRDHLLGNTLREAFRKAANPDKLFVGAVVQNCFGLEYTCRTGVEVVGTGPNGRPKTKVSDAPPDKNGVEEFCEDAEFVRYCDAGQVRTLYVNETESLGPAIARYYASKLWGGETFYVQVDAHLQFAKKWDERYVKEVKAAKSYPKAVLSSYPPGFSEGSADVGGSLGARLCSCEFSTSDVESQIIRINTGANYHGTPDHPSQIAFIAAGFFFARAEFLIDVPFDPMMPWCFMGEEIALSMRAWTSGWDIYAPRINLIAHQYRPGRMGLPKFWETVGRNYGRPGPSFNTQLQRQVIERIKFMVGYPECTRQKIEAQGDELVLQDIEYYSMGTVRTREAYLELTNIDLEKKTCHRMAWCSEGTLE